MPQYRDAARTHLTKGVCLGLAGQLPESEASLLRAYELEPMNPSIAVNLSEVLYRRGDFERARFFIRRVNAVPALANSQTCGLRHGSNTALAMRRACRFRRAIAAPIPRSREFAAFQRGGFDSDMPNAAAAPLPCAGHDCRRSAAAGTPAQGLHIAALAAAIKVTPRSLSCSNRTSTTVADATFTRALAQAVCRR